MTKPTRLIWLDMEMSGLDVNVERPLEVAIIITDEHLNEVAVLEIPGIRQDKALLDQMVPWCQDTHGRSGLIDRVLQSDIDEQRASEIMLAFLQAHTDPQSSPMCGNTIYQDRKFMERYFPTVNEHFHYRNIDVSSIKELCKIWRPDVYEMFKKRNAHTALSDVQESIAELKHYQKYFLQCGIPVITPPEIEIGLHSDFSNWVSTVPPDLLKFRAPDDIETERLYYLSFDINDPEQGIIHGEGYSTEITTLVGTSIRGYIDILSRRLWWGHEVSNIKRVRPIADGMSTFGLIPNNFHYLSMHFDILACIKNSLVDLPVRDRPTQTPPLGFIVNNTDRNSDDSLLITVMVGNVGPRRRCTQLVFDTQSGWFYNPMNLPWLSWADGSDGQLEDIMDTAIKLPRSKNASEHDLQRYIVRP